MIIKLKENGKFIQVIQQLNIKHKGNGKFHYQLQLILYLLKILIKCVPSIQRIIIYKL